MYVSIFFLNMCLLFNSKKPFFKHSDLRQLDFRFKNRDNTNTRAKETSVFNFLSKPRKYKTF